MDSSRAFVAVELGPGPTQVVERLIKTLKGKVADVRWSRPDQLHLTLKFIGDIDNRELPQVCDALRRACESIEPFAIQLNGLGAFPKNKPPRVVWVAVDAGAEPLRQLAERLDETLEAVGIPREGREFTPHLTLGRVARGANLDSLQTAIDSAGPQFAVGCEIDEIILFGSLKDQGQVIYERLDSVELQG